MLQIEGGHQQFFLQKMFLHVLTTVKMTLLMKYNLYLRNRLVRDIEDNGHW